MERFRSLRGLLALVALTAAVTSGTGCGKSVVDVSIEWHGDLDVALASARAQDKPLFVYFGASWDKAAKELEHDTLVDPEVRIVLARDFVSLRVDASDDEDPHTRALQHWFKVVGDPTIIVVAPDGVSEIVRFNEFVPPRVLARALRSCGPGPYRHDHALTGSLSPGAMAADNSTYQLDTAAARCPSSNDANRASRALRRDVRM